jgi:hypothetical protein
MAHHDTVVWRYHTGVIIFCLSRILYIMMLLYSRMIQSSLAKRRREAKEEKGEAEREYPGTRKEEQSSVVESCSFYVDLLLMACAPYVLY